MVIPCLVWFRKEWSRHLFPVWFHSGRNAHKTSFPCLVWFREGMIKVSFPCLIWFKKKSSRHLSPVWIHSGRNAQDTFPLFSSGRLKPRTRDTSIESLKISTAPIRSPQKAENLFSVVVVIILLLHINISKKCSRCLR